MIAVFIILENSMMKIVPEIVKKIPGNRGFKLTSFQLYFW